MKDLISVFAYCPDNFRKKILQDLLNQLQPIRDRFEIIVVAHSPISELSQDLVDHFYYDSCNKLLTDFDVRKKHWYSNHLWEKFYQRYKDDKFWNIFVNPTHEKNMIIHHPDKPRYYFHINIEDVDKENKN